MAIIRVFTPTDVKELEHGDSLQECKSMSYEQFYNVDTPEKLAEKQSL